MTKYLIPFAVIGLAAAHGDSLTHETAPRLSDADLTRLEMAASVENDAEAALSAARDLVLQQSRILPAYRDLYQARLDRLLATIPEAAPGAEAIAAAYAALYRNDQWVEKFGGDAGGSIVDSPWDLSDFHHPIIAAVDFPNVVVRQAIWDYPAETLLFTLEPRTPGATTFRITNIPTNYVARLDQNGRQIAAIDEHGQASGRRVMNLGPGEIEVTVNLERETHFAIRPE